MNISPVKLAAAGQNVYGCKKDNRLNNTGKNINTSPAFGAVIGKTSDLKVRLDIYVDMVKNNNPDKIREMIKAVDAKISSIFKDRSNDLQAIEELPKFVQKFRKGKLNKIEEKFVSEYIALNNQKKKLLAELDNRQKI